MRFAAPLISGILLKRYKRFLADVRLETGETITAHTANPGSMKGLIEPGNRVYLSHHPDPKRKLKYSWEIVQLSCGLVGINTALANHLAEEAIRAQIIPELAGYEELKREVPYGKNSRIDFLLSGKNKKCFVEVKNVTLVEEDIAYFPDAVTERGRKHLGELEAMVRQGFRAVMLYIVQRPDGGGLATADHIDSKYGEAFRQAMNHGVEALAYRAKVSPEEILVCERMEVRR